MILNGASSRSSDHSTNLFSNSNIDNNVMNSIDGANALKLDEKFEINEKENNSFFGDINEDILISGIGDKIAQVFHNLIDNALSFSSKGDCIDISIWKSNTGAIVEIKDNGPGIPKESLLKVFDRFYTYRPNDKSFGNNSGLGLSICKQIVKTHGGSIIAGNKENGGAIFTVTFPLVNK